jgi:hypothetical protein
MLDAELNQEVAQRRRAASERYRPEHVKVLLVGEQPPALLSRYFYFEDVDHHDGLFWDVVKATTGELMSDRHEKPQYLAELMALGVFLIDLKEDPADSRPMEACISDLIARCRELHPERIIIIKPEVFDAAFIALRNAGLPVINRRIPFPTTGNQLLFATAFAAAMKQPPPALEQNAGLP